MEPQIQYAKTSDGVNIAYALIGSGPPLVFLDSQPVTNIQVELQHPEYGPIYRLLAAERQLVLYDCRGSGMSQRRANDYSLEARVLDLEAVADQASLETFPLVGMYGSGPVAIAYAVRHPERVSHLVLWVTWARASSFYEDNRMRAVQGLLEHDWELYTETLAHVFYGWGETASRELGEVYRQCITQETARAFYEEDAKIDVTDMLPKIKAPTLVLQCSRIPFPDLNTARELAASVPNARLVVQEGTWLPVFQVYEESWTAILEFVSEGEARKPVAADLPSGMLAILFADIADSTALTERMGDAAFREKARELDGGLRAVIREHGGTPIEGKLLGDGVLAVFTSAREAIEAARRCGRAGNDAGLPLHVGIHAGDVIREEDNVYGGAVNIASRISGLSAPGEVLVSDTVRSLARTSVGVSFEDRGEQSLKGVGEAVRVWAVREGDA